MHSKEFYEEIDKYIKGLEKEDIINFVNNIIRKIPENKFEEIMCIINESEINDVEIKQKIKKFKDNFKKIEDGEIYFYANQYEDYSRGWDDWTIEYSDQDNIDDLIIETAEYAVKLVNYKKYHYAKELFDLILKTNYQALDEEMEQDMELSLDEAHNEGVISIDLHVLCSYIIYVTYQISKNKVKDIYNYFENYHIFNDATIENALKIGTEQLEGIEEFFNEWINYLSKTQSDIGYKLLKEALDYTKYRDYTKYVESMTENQPKIYIDIFNYLERENRIDELKALGENILNTIDKRSETGSDIALYLAEIDTRNKEKYIYEGFMFKPTVLNLLRIINNGYYAKHEKDIKEKITKSYKDEVISKEEYYYLKFFSGDFAEFYEECINHSDLLGWSYSFEKMSVYLWLLLLNKSIENTRCNLIILKEVFEEIKYKDKENMFLDESFEDIWRKWNSYIKFDDAIKDKVINWIKERIENRVDAIIEGNYRKSYYKIAILVVGLDEMMESQQLGENEEYIDYYKSKYSRRSSFKREIDELL